MKMLKTKHLRRIAVFLAMIAPAVYLFGSLFSALSGAHGTQVFADEQNNEMVLRLSYTENVGIDGTTGALLPADGRFCSNLLDVHQFQGNNFSLIDTSGSGSFPRVYYYGVDNSFISWQTSSFIVPSTCYYLRVVDYGVGTASVVFSGVSFAPAIDASSYSDYVFGQFFTKDNFLVDWGRDAISENPHGFAPFGAFWRYLDTNVLHLSSQQIGLMGYGYVYYACHVLLFDIAFILVTFFLDFIQKVNDKIVGGVD